VHKSQPSSAESEIPSKSSDPSIEEHEKRLDALDLDKFKGIRTLTNLAERVTNLEKITQEHTRTIESNREWTLEQLQNNRDWMLEQLQIIRTSERHPVTPDEQVMTFCRELRGSQLLMMDRFNVIEGLLDESAIRESHVTHEAHSTPTVLHDKTYEEVLQENIHLKAQLNKNLNSETITVESVVQPRLSAIESFVNTSAEILRRKRSFTMTMEAGLEPRLSSMEESVKRMESNIQLLGEDLKEKLENLEAQMRDVNVLSRLGKAEICLERLCSEGTALSSKFSISRGFSSFEDNRSAA